MSDILERIVDDLRDIKERIGELARLETPRAAAPLENDKLLYGSGGKIASANIYWNGSLVGMGPNIANRPQERLLSVMGSVGDATIHVGSYGSGSGDSDTYLWAGYPGTSFYGGGVGYNWRQNGAGGLARNNTSKGGAFVQFLENILSLNTVDNAGTSRLALQASGGVVGVGVAANSTYRLLVRGADTSTTAYAALFQNSTPANLMYLRNDGQTWANQAWTISDRRAKKGITASPYGLAQLRAAPKPHKYKLRLNDSEQLGFLADELAPFFPELVTPADHCIHCQVFKHEHQDRDHPFDPTLSVNYSGLIAVLWQAVQELAAEVKTKGK